MDLPKLVEKNEIPSATEWNKMVECLRSLAPAPSDDIIPSVLGSGTTWRLRRQKNTIDDIHPFKIVGAGLGDAFSVWFGTVGNKVPSGVCSGGSIPTFSGSGDVYLTVNIGANGLVSSASVGVGTMPTDDPDDEDQAHILIGKIQSGVVYQSLIHSLFYMRYYALTESGLVVNHVFGAV
ncbi:MAG TPA: hypothetical protein PLU30_23655 [Verrucomicrobiae bacterium]|nr:hypothetical protein [Verrucomicrobiae bacterium]